MKSLTVIPQRKQEASARSSALNKIESYCVQNTAEFARKLTLSPDLMNGVNRESVEFLLTTIFEAGLTDELEIIRTSKKCSKFVRNTITEIFLTNTF